MSIFNKKEVREKIQNYIINNINLEGYEEYNLAESTLTPNQKILAVVDIMSNTWWNGYERRRTPNIRQAFVEYVMCLPDCIFIDYYYDKMDKLLEEWSGQSGFDYDYEIFYKLIGREFWCLYNNAKNANNKKEK